MNFFPMPKLGHIALVKTAVSLFTEDDVRELVSNFCSRTCDHEGRRFQQFVSKMVLKASTLLLPDPLKTKLSGYIRPITKRILSWLGLLGDRCYIIPKLPREYCWTPYGFIDYEKTAENWLNDKRIDRVSHFRIAITYCLGNRIEDTWKQLPRNISTDLEYIRMCEPQLLSYWLHFLSEKIGPLDVTVMQYCRIDNVTTIPTLECVLNAAVSNGNYAATKYFLSKLTFEEKDNIIIDIARDAAKRRSSIDDTCFPKYSDTDVFCLLLSTMNETQQIKIFSEDPNFGLKCFLDWPWQGFFTELLERTWEFVFAEECFCLLTAIHDKVVEGYKDYNYQELFTHVWQKVHDNDKEYIINICGGSSLMLELLKVKAKEYIALILNDATIDQKEEIIFCEQGKHTCKSLVENNLLDMFEYFVETCTSSKYMTIKFKSEFKEYIISIYSKRKIKNGVWKKCFQLLDKCIRKWNKRTNGGGEDSSAKRLCGMEEE